MSRTAARNWYLAAALFIAFIAAAPLFFNSGLLNTRGGGDSPFLLQRLQQLTTALADGHFPVRWMPDANYGYGYPFYNYYAPLSIYVAAAFRFLGAGYVLAVKVAQLAGFVVAAWSMFALGRRWLGNNWAGLLAAAAYTLAPFHMVNVYVRGDSLAEFWAMAFYPLLVLGIDRLAAAALGDIEGGKRARRVGVALLALVYAALILSHNISALIFTPFVLLYLVFDWWDGRETPLANGTGNGAGQKQEKRQTQGKQLLWVAMALLLALGLAAWFWLPALAESSLAQLEPVTEGYFHYSNHFRDSDLVQRSLVFDYDTAGGRVFSTGLVQAIGILLGTAGLLIYGRRKRSFVNRGRRLFIVSGLLLATFMITSLSLWLWDNLPLLSFTQLPWRFLSVQAFFGALATAGLALSPGRRVIVPLATGLLILSALIGLQLDFLKLADGDVTAGKLAEYEWYSGNIGTTVSAEYLPENVQPRPQTSPWLNQGRRDVAQVLQGQASAIEPLERRSTRQEWLVTTGEEGALISLPTMAWPGWQGRVDGEPVTLVAADGSGLISLSVPPGEHLIELKLGRTPVRLVGEIVALAALLAWIWLLLVGVSIQRPERRALFLIGGLLLLLVALRIWPEAEGQEDDLNWDFAQMAYLHHGDEGVEFDNGARLAGYQYSADELAAGESLAVTLFWEEGATGQARLELVTPAANRSPRAPAFAQQLQDVRSGTVTYELALPDNAPAGSLVPRLIVDGAKPLTPSGLSRGDLSLRPLLLKDISLPAEDGPGRLDARALRVTARDERVLDLQLQWLTRQALNQNYNYSIRLVDGSGRQVAQQDGQPGFGFLPSSGWSAGLWTDDWIGLNMVEAIRATNGPLDLVARLYEVPGGDVVLTRLLGQLEWRQERLVFTPVEPVFALSGQATSLAAAFGPTDSGVMIDLAGIDADYGEDALNLTLYWSAENMLPEDLTHFVHLEDADGAIVAQHDGMPRHNSYPTSQWVAGEIVADSLRIDLSPLEAGDYTLYVGLYHLQNGLAARLPVADDGGLPATADRLSPAGVISIAR
jgi:hypothetical protein